MTLKKERQKEKKARDLIYKALEEYFGCDPMIPEFTEDKVPVSKYHEKLKPRGIEAGVTALLLINNMTAGSDGDISLYQLIERYLLNKEVREKMNRVMTQT